MELKAELIFIILTMNTVNSGELSNMIKDLRFVLKSSSSFRSQRNFLELIKSSIAFSTFSISFKFSLIKKLSWFLQRVCRQKIMRTRCKRRISKFNSCNSLTVRGKMGGQALSWRTWDSPDPVQWLWVWHVVFLFL